MASRYDSFDNGSPAQDRIRASFKKVGRSVHDYSRTVVGNTMLGLLAPIDCFEVVPSEHIDLNLSAILDFRNPTTRKLYNGFRVFFHARYNRLTDLWEGAKNFIDRGRSGDITLRRPNAIWIAQYPNSDVMADALTPMSLMNFLQMPATHLQLNSANFKFQPLRSFSPCIYTAETETTSGIPAKKLGNSTEFFPADCLMAYQRNWRDFYANKNLLQNNKGWFPDNEDHFILSYNCERALAICYEDETLSKMAVEDGITTGEAAFMNLTGRTSAVYPIDGTVKTPLPNNPSVNRLSVNNSAYQPNLAGIKFVQFRGDRFTTASPFPDLIRGDIPTLDLVEDNFVHAEFSSDYQGRRDFTFNNESSSGFATRDMFFRSNNVGQASIRVDSVDGPSASLYIKSNSITMSDIYTLETLTAFKRRMGMTNGDYNEAISAQFGGHNPRVHDRRGTYIGGFYMDFTTEGVVQQSESANTPLGTIAGQGSGAGRGSLGSFDVPDYGWIQIYMFIVPDVFYTQGKPRQYSKQSPIDMYFPIFNNLPAQEIRNDELLVNGNVAVDAQPFAYEDRYAEFKGRVNIATGFTALPHSVAEFDASRIMARRISARPNFNSQFTSLVPENQDMSVFSVVDEPPFDFRANISVRRVFPGPYMAVEGSLSSPGLN